MAKLPALRKSLPLATVVASALFVLLSMSGAEAQQAAQRQ